MPGAFSLRTNLAAVLRDLDDFAKKEIPYVTAVALTRAAGDARDHLRARLGQHFTIRSNWVANSIQSEKANKKDADPTAIVGSTYWPMWAHTEGGQKTGRGGDVGIPVEARADPQARTNPSQFPGRLSGRPGFFVAPFSRSPFRIGSGSEVGVFERVALGRGAAGPAARGRKAKHSRAAESPRHLKLWWTLEPEVKIKADWPFEAEALQAVDAHLLDHFFAALEGARATAR